MKLICPECRRENEPERIYCHDCGARLDRTALAKEKPKEEDPKDTQRRLRAMLDPHRAKMRQRFFQLSKLLLIAVLGAGIIQILRAPDLPPRPTSPILPAQISMDLENAAMEARGQALRYSDAQVNAYLGYTFRTKQAALSLYYLKFERAVVDFQEGFCDVAVERSLFGVPLVVSGSYTAALRDGNIQLVNRGGHLGRMPVHPMLMKYAGPLLADVARALERERKSLVKLAAFEFHPQMVLLVAKGAPQT